MKKIKILKSLLEKVPNIELSTIECDVVVTPPVVNFDVFAEKVTKEIAASIKIEEISQMTTVKASRQAYKKCGKDPARYRLSAEALLRRIAKGMDLYRINNVVDLLNIVSVNTGFSIGGYDVNKIIGDIEFGIGKANEPYEAIGRGNLNIENLTVFRDKLGAFGSPTSDSVRTSVTDSTTHFLMVIIGFGENEKLNIATSLAIQLLKEFAFAKNIETKNIKN